MSQTSSSTPPVPQTGVNSQPLYPPEMQAETAARQTLIGEAHTAANASYRLAGTPGTAGLPNGWQRRDVPSTETELREAMAKAGAVRLESPSGQSYVAFKGSQTLSDWKENVKQAVGSKFGLYSEKYAAAARVGELLKDANPPVTFTGHSMGGGLAKLAAEAASKDSNSKLAIGFNAASVAPATYRQAGLEPKIHERTTIHVVNENDTLNRFVKGGKLSAGGAALADRERSADGETRGESMIVVARGGGSARGSGHSISNFVPMGSAQSDRAFTAPIATGDGTTKSLADYDTYRPQLPNAQQAVATLERSSSQLEIGQHRNSTDLSQSGGRG